MIRKIRNSFWTKVVAVYLTMNLIGEIVFPTMAMALTSGPVSIDQASFEPAATSEMVDLTTGDFTYNIPLLDVDGYPINLAYHGGVGMDQEASMVGLGWSLNVGAINRSMRGLPDDFNGDEVTTEMNMRPRYSVGGSIGLSGELVGFDAEKFSLGEFDFGFGGNVGVGVGFDNYTGFSTDVFAGLSFQVIAMEKIGGSLGVQINSGSQDGLTISPSLGLSLGKDEGPQLQVGIGYNYNSLAGLVNKSVTGGIGYTDKSSIGIRGTAIMPISTVSYTPNITFETNTISRNYDISAGATFCFWDAEAQYRAYKSITCNENVSETVPAYGYLYQEYHKTQPAYLLDYNQQGAVQTNKFIENLPITNNTFDAFSATAQGLGFSFRAHRSEVGIVAEMDRSHDINGVGLSGEIAAGEIFQAGVNVNIPSGYIQSGKWEDNNSIISDMNFKHTAPTNANEYLYEKFYFKKFGNRTSGDDSFYSNMGAAKAVKQKITKSGVTHNGTIQFRDKDGNLQFESDDQAHYKTERDLRNTGIQYLPAKEAEKFGLADQIDSYSLTNYTYTTGQYSATSTDRYGTLSSEAKSHHLSEMTVLEGDGSRYVYGIPVINHKTYQVTFNVSDESSNSSAALTRDCEQGLVSYGSGDNSINNKRGATNLFLKTTVPASASSYLLTAYLSSNYIDRTLDGPTPDDFGNYTKFNYSNVGVTKWRFPFEENQAAYNEGLKADHLDDMGSYVYGERDQWYLHSIESKNFVAELHYGDRHDGYGVDDENGGAATTNYSKRLVKIELYTRQGRINGESPIKTVHFEYDYSLCDNVPNNDGAAVSSEEGVSQNQGGKLTLKAIYFTYGSSNRGKLHKYTFDYSTKNPDYELGAEDRWGTYKSIAASTACDHTGNLTNIEYPYAEQTKATADENAGAWMLKTIHLPSGSDINVSVESDDYAYVQDKHVTRMYVIKGFSETTTFNDTEEEVLYESVIDGMVPHNYLHVDVGNLGTSQSAAETNFKNNYLHSNEIYFKMLVKVSPVDLPYNTMLLGDKYEYISGYAKVDINGCVAYDSETNGTYESVAIKLKDVSLEDEQETPFVGVYANPVSKASWQFIRKYLPGILNPTVGDIYSHDDDVDCQDIGEVPDYVEDDEIDTDPETESDGEFLKNIINTGQSHLQNIISAGGVNLMMSTFLYASQCVPSKSWVRLGMGTNPKFGGGHRVKEITVNDNWDDVKVTESASTYGSTYTYETSTENGDVITSGVASYEPISSGSDENPMRQPVHYTIDIKMRVNDDEFQELPFGETIFANPGVAYSKVTVSNIDYTNVSQNSTGKTVYEHYTAKDFPVVFDYTGSASASAIESSNNWTSLFTMENYSYLTMSQGYSIHINDMHGKFKSKKVFGAQVSSLVEPPQVYSMEHKYYTEANNPSILNNHMSVVDPGGTISQRYIGRDLDMVVSLNETKSNYQAVNFDAGINVSSCAAGFPIPSLWYSNYSIENRYRSSVTTKVITSTGILEEVILVDKGRYKSSKNLLFDANTGVPVVTEINHEQPTPNSTYEKPIYQYDYPAYWIYEGMGLASENWGASFTNIVTEVSGHYLINLTNKELYLNPGDEISVYNITTGAYETGKFWILEHETSGDYYLIDKNGADPTFTLTGNSHLFRVIRSGKRNLLGSTAASVTSLTKYTTSPYADGFSHSAVLNASAVEYTDEAYSYLSSSTGSTDFCGIQASEVVNPYIWGLRGNWNLLTSYVYDSGRDQTTGHSRTDGVLSDYIEFWENNSGVWEKNTNALVADRWIQAAIATLFDREGFNLESKDALGIYSSIQLGYNRTLKIAEAVNARYYQVGFDGFEDRAYDVSSDCTTPHFRFTGNSVTNALAHTGRYCASVSGGEMMSLTSDVKNSIDHTTTAHAVPYTVQSQELIKKHTYLSSASEPSKYVLTFWAREGSKLPTETSYGNISVEIRYNGTPLTNLVEHRTNIIDGWQRIEVTFELPSLPSPAGTENCQIRLLNNATGPMYFDDIRVQPYNSEMVSYVIDPVSLRLWATLDSRNFATFYQYDEEGSLVRIIQETERGRFTVQENRAGIRIN